MKKFNMAIIGQGRSGRDIHGAFFATEAAKERFTLVAVADNIAQRRERATAEYGCDVYDDYKKLLRRDDIDIVVNASFSHLHYPITKEVLEAGFNVICEKPAASRAAEVDDLIKTAEKSGKMYNVFQQSRLTPYFRQIKKVLAEGKLGRIVEISIAFNGYARRWDWQTLQSFKGGNLLNTGPHPLDQALNLLDMYDGMPDIMCKMDRANTFGDAEDYVKLIMTAPGKPLIDLSISSCDAYPTHTYKIMGTRGGLKGSMTNIEWKYYIADEAPEQKLIREPLSKPNGTPAYCGEKLEFHTENWTSADSGAFDNAVANYYNMIYAYLTEGTPMEITPRQVRQQIAVIEECHRQNPLSQL
ncbi:MAG: Gfo/Idh/MocA family oxidoreductase [Eubacteriales bacterium]|nr:Gfo/Idh/MocA family oxidoreductase [Eubacteriales bacterium]